MRRFLVLIALFSAVAVTPGCARSKPLATPNFNTSSMNPEVNTKAIRAALAGRGWTVTGEQRGRIEANYTKGEHVARIAVLHNANNIKIELLSSEELLAGTGKDGEPTIHRNYNNWVKYLEDDIQAEVARQ